MRSGFVVAAAFVVAATLRETPASGDDTVEHVALLDRSHTVAELEGGILALPSAPISPANRGGSTPLGSVGNGDATVMTGLHVLYRADSQWAIGAGATFAPRPTSDPNYGGALGGAGGLQRTHSRSYLILGGEGRYFPLHTRTLQGWLGVTGGGIVVGDRFTTNGGAAVPSLLGDQTVTVSTEGLSVGVQAGLDYLITDRLVVGLALRADWWLLPKEKPFSAETSCDTIGDCPTLTGSVAAFEMSVTFGYRIPL
jgi:hypothetical protein